MEPTSKLSGGWLFLGILVSCALLPVVWNFIAKRQIGRGRNSVLAHSMGFVAGFLAFLSALLSLLVLDTGSGYVGALILWGLTAWCLAAWAGKPFPKPLHQAGSIKPAPPIYQVAPDNFTGEGSDLIRKYSGKTDEDYLAELLAEIDSDTKPKKRTRKLVKSPVSGSIAFEYIDTKHEMSRRVVSTKEVDARHISGYCRTAGAFRTFLIEGIVSDVTDTETGEVMTIAQWIKQAKKAAKAKMLKK